MKFLSHLFQGQIQRQIWFAFLGLAGLFLLTCFKIYSDLRELGTIADAINELNGVAVSVQYMAHDGNAYLLDHAEHAEEFKEHAIRLRRHWKSFRAHQAAHGGVPDSEKPLFDAIDNTTEKFITASRDLFDAYDARKKHPTGSEKPLQTAWLKADDAGNTIDAAVTSYIDIHLDEISVFKASARNGFIAAVVFLSLGGVFMTYRIGKSISTPVGQLVSAAKAFELGDFNHRADVDSRNELGVVSTAFNAMAKQVQAFNQTLEDRVRSRTRELEESRSRMEAIIQRIMDGIVIFNAKGEIDSCNPAAARVFGVKLDDMSGMTVAALIESDDGAVPPDLKLLAESGDSVEFRYGAGEDSADWIEAAAALLPLADETLLIGVFRDVSGRRRAEDEIRTLNENLEQRVAERTIQLRGANDNLQHALDNLRETQGQLVESEKMASLGGLVAGVAHEINTPLGICVTASSHLNDVSGKLAEKFKQGGMRRSDMESFLKVNDESNAIILTNLQRAANLVRSFKQVAVDQSSEERRRFGLAAYLDEVLISLRPYLKKGNHEVIVECDDSIEVDGYPGALSQIITNLVMNSLTHAYAEGVVGTLRMQAKKMEGDEIRLCYNDDGIGIPEDHIAKVFDPFFTTKRGSGGSGLGLNILYNLVTQKLGGRVKCESEPGEGATFIIKFPAQYMASSSNP